MRDKMEGLVRLYEEKQEQLADPAIYADASALRRLGREVKELEPLVACYRAWNEAQECIAQAEELLGDAELHEMAQEELRRERALAERLREELTELLLPRDGDDEKSVVMEIRGGVGGEEGCLFAADLFRMYSLYAENRGWTTEIVSRSESEMGGCKEICFLVEGAGAYARLKFEAGIHRVQRIPQTESQGRIHTSAATVAVLPQAEEVELSILPSELQIDTFRSSGAGGQHVNKTESAIRITHLPTGIVVECQDERSQHKNRDRAMTLLRSRLYEAQQQRQRSEIAEERRSQVGSGDRSERIRTYNYPQNRVTDHRLTGEEKNFPLAAVMDGALEGLIDALATAERTEKLRREGGA